MKQISFIFSVMLFLTLTHPPGIPAAQPGDKLVSFSGETMAGKTINIDRVIGKKPVLLFFWATW